MISWLTRRRRERAKAIEVYGAVVAGARSPYLYSQFGVSDTPEGRLEMVLAMLVLTLGRLRRVPGRDNLVQAVIETFVTDMDDCLREMGVGDLTVPKKVKRAAAAFYARADAYGPSLSRGDVTGLAAALAVTLADLGATIDCSGLAEHMVHLSEALSACSDEDALQPARLQAILSQEPLGMRTVTRMT